MSLVSISQREAVILSLLVNGEKFGREIRKAYEASTRHSMPIGSLYTTLDRMELKGVVKSREGDPNPEYGGNRRRFYKLTATGERTLNAHLASLGLNLGASAHG